MANCAVGIIKPASHNIVIWIMCQQMNALEAVLRNPEYYQKMMKQDYLFMEMDVSVNENGNVKYMYKHIFMMSF